MPKVRWVLSYGFCSKFYTLSSSAKNLENRLRFDKVTDSLKMGIFFETQCTTSGNTGDLLEFEIFPGSVGNINFISVREF